MFNGDVSCRTRRPGSSRTSARARPKATNQRDVQELVLEQSRDRLDSVRGVNLDEEAADMLRFEQLYQAAAQDDAVADSLFDTLLNTLLR